MTTQRGFDLDAQTGITIMMFPLSSWFEQTFTNDKSYQYYRLYIPKENNPGQVSVKELFSQQSSSLAMSAFGGPNLVSAIPDATVFPGGSKSFNVASHFNATKSPGSAFKYFVTTNNHALLEVRNASQDLGTFELKSLSTSGNATVTVKVVAVERDVDVWVATSTFAVSVGNIAPTIKLALPDVTGTKTLSLSKYFKDDHGQLTYSLTVEDPNVVNATLVGSTLYVQSGLFRDGRSLVTVTASDGFANVSSAINASYVFSVSLQYSSLNTFEFILAATNTKLVSFQRSGCLRRERRHCLVRWVEKRPNGSNRDDGRGWSVQPDRPIE
jgi:hypothetical protein